MEDGLQQFGEHGGQQALIGAASQHGLQHFAVVLGEVVLEDVDEMAPKYLGTEMEIFQEIVNISVRWLVV